MKKVEIYHEKSCRNRYVILIIIVLFLFSMVAVFSGIMKLNSVAFSVGSIVEEKTESVVNSDIADGVEIGCFSENSGVSPLSLDGKNSCVDYCKTHGVGRVYGGTTLLDRGCRNYASSGYNYGTTEIPYWINMSTLNQISNSAHRTQMLADIRAQTAMWNGIHMHDGTGQIINIYEVAPNTTSKPNKINNKDVIEVSQCDMSEKYKGESYSGSVGLFWHSGKIEVNYDATYYGERYGYNIDTIVHEFGHALGLTDLDTLSGVSKYGTHKTLMGYSRGTTTATLSKAITYPDIQGVAVMTGRHVCKDSHFMRYVKQGSQYLHICFYCDRIDSRTSSISSSQPVVNTNYCAHQYEPMVSSASQNWLKCVKCYKVVEEGDIQVSGLFGGGTGTKEDPYLIRNESQFRNIGMAYTKSGSLKILPYSYKLMTDIALTNENWIPFASKYTGQFDGNGHSVTYSTMITQAVLDMPKLLGKFGLFGYIGSGGVVKNLELKNCSISTDGSVSYPNQLLVGTLAGYIEAVADISSVTISSPTITIAQFNNVLIGGIAGSASRTNINNCVVNGGSITCYNQTVGGFAGMGDIGGINGGSCKITIRLSRDIYDKVKDRTGRILSNYVNNNSNVVTNVTYSYFG